jgi:hypothetical protein
VRYGRRRSPFSASHTTGAAPRGLGVGPLVVHPRSTFPISAITSAPQISPLASYVRSATSYHLSGPMEVAIDRPDRSVATGSARTGVQLPMVIQAASNGAQRSGGGAGQTPTACPEVMWPRTALVHLVAELSGVRIHRTGSSRRLSSETPARRGHVIPAPRNLHSLITEGGIGFRHPAALLFGTDLAPLGTDLALFEQSDRGTIGRPRPWWQCLPPCAGTPPTPPR